METFIYKYLSRHYQVGSSNELSKNIRLIDTYGIYIRSEEKTKVLVYGKKLVAELSGVFDLKELEATKLINDWAVTQDKWVNLKWYWLHKEPWFPEITRVLARTIQQDLIGVQPMNSPTGELMYLDYQYSGATVRVNEKSIKEIKLMVKDDEERFRQSWFSVSSRKENKVL